MEDTHIAYPDLGDGNALFGVFDGHGGHEVAVFVKEHFKSNLIKNAAYKSGDFKKALEQVFVKMDRLLQTDKGKVELAAYMKKGGAGKGYPKQFALESQAGCTATVVLLTPTELWCANAGDSRTIISENGQAVDMSVDHKPDMPEEYDRIIKAGGEVEDSRVNGILALSRAIGDFEYKPPTPPKDANESWFKNNHMVTSFPDVTVKQMHNSVELIVLACDGIWDCLTSAEVI